MKVSASRYATLVNRVREIHTNNGTKLWHSPDDFGDIDWAQGSENGEIIFKFYHDGLSRIVVPEGEITPLGSRQTGDSEKIMEELQSEFGLEHIRSIDGMIGERWHEYQATKGLS